MIVGLTGGIGSGKSTIARMFGDYGVPIYTADDRAKDLMTSNGKLIIAIKKLLGEDAYNAGMLNRPFIASKIFSDNELRYKLNKLVHPVVEEDFHSWLSTNQAQYVIKEAAILFENGGYKKTDFNILVTAPEEVRIDRVIKRDNSTSEKVRERIAAQWPDVKKMALADITIHNLNLKDTQKEVQQLHHHLDRRARLGW